jgi:hypothetical protein
VSLVLQESLRRIVRAVLPRDLFRFCACQYEKGLIAITQGREVYRILYDSTALAGTLRSVTLRGMRHPFYFRSSTQDVQVIIQNLIRQEWGQFTAMGAGWIIDAGGYIGDAATYFLNRFPGKQSHLS